MAKTAMPATEKSRRTGLPVSSAYGISVISGTSSATGPFVRAPTPIAAQGRIGRSSQNAMMAIVVQQASALSKIVVRAYARTSGVVASARPASQPVSDPQRRRPNRTTTTMVTIVNRKAGRRAAVSVGPRTSITPAAAAK